MAKVTLKPFIEPDNGSSAPSPRAKSLDNEDSAAGTAQRKQQTVPGAGHMGELGKKQFKIPARPSSRRGSADPVKRVAGGPMPDFEQAITQPLPRVRAHAWPGVASAGASQVEEQKIAQGLERKIEEQKRALSAQFAGSPLPKGQVVDSKPPTPEITLIGNPNLTQELVTKRFSGLGADPQAPQRLSDQILRMLPPDSIAPEQGASAILIEALATECDGSVYGAMHVLHALQKKPADASAISRALQAKPVVRSGLQNVDRSAAMAYRVQCRLARTEIGRRILKFGPEAAGDPKQRAMLTACAVAFAAAGDLIAAQPQAASHVKDMAGAWELAQQMPNNDDDAAFAGRAFTCAVKILQSQGVSADEADAYLLYRSGVSSAAEASAIKTRVARCLPEPQANVRSTTRKERMASYDGKAPVVTKGTIEQWDMLRSVAATETRLLAHLDDLRLAYPDAERLAKDPRAVQTAVRLATLAKVRDKMGQWADGCIDFTAAEADQIAEAAAGLLGIQRRVFSPGNRLKRSNPGWAVSTYLVTAHVLRAWVDEAVAPIHDNSTSALEIHMRRARAQLAQRLNRLNTAAISNPKVWAQSQDRFETAIMAARLQIELDDMKAAKTRGAHDDTRSFIAGGLAGASAKGNRIARLAAKMLELPGLGTRQTVMRNSAWLPILSQDLTIDVEGTDDIDEENDAVNEGYAATDTLLREGTVDAWGRWADEEPLNLAASIHQHRVPRPLRRQQPKEPLSHTVRVIEESPIDPYLPKPSNLPADTGASLEDLKRLVSSLQPGGQICISARAINGIDATAAINSPSWLAFGLSVTALPSYTKVDAREMTVMLEADDGVRGTAVRIRLGTAEGGTSGWGFGAAVSTQPGQPVQGPLVGRAAIERYYREKSLTLEAGQFEFDCGSFEQSLEKAVELIAQMQQSAMPHAQQDPDMLPAENRAGGSDAKFAPVRAYYSDPTVTVRHVHRQESGTISTISLIATAGISTVFQNLPWGYNAWTGPFTRQKLIDLHNRQNSREKAGPETTFSEARVEANGDVRMGLVGWLPSAPLPLGSSIGMASTAVPVSAKSTPRVPVTTLVHLGESTDPDQAFYRSHAFNLAGFNAWQKQALPPGQRLSLDEFDVAQAPAESGASGGRREVLVETPLTAKAAAQVRTILQTMETITARGASGKSDRGAEERIADYQAALSATLDYADSWDHEKTVVVVQDRANADRVERPFGGVFPTPYWQRAHTASAEVRQRTVVRRGGPSGS